MVTGWRLFHNYGIIAGMTIDNARGARSWGYVVTKLFKRYMMAAEACYSNIKELFPLFWNKAGH